MWVNQLIRSVTVAYQDVCGFQLVKPCDCTLSMNMTFILPNRDGDLGKFILASH